MLRHMTHRWHIDCTSSDSHCSVSQTGHCSMTTAQVTPRHLRRGRFEGDDHACKSHFQAGRHGMAVACRRAWLRQAQPAQKAPGPSRRSQHVKQLHEKGPRCAYYASTRDVDLARRCCYLKLSMTIAGCSNTQMKWRAIVLTVSCSRLHSSTPISGKSRSKRARLIGDDRFDT